MDNVVENKVVKKSVKKDKKKFEWNLFSIILCAFLILYAISFIIPLSWGFLTSLKSEVQFHNKRDILGLPSLELWGMEYEEEIRGKLFGNYLIFFRNAKVENKTQYIVGIWNTELIKINKTSGILEWVVHTLLYAVGCTLTFLIVTVSVGYLAAKYRYPFSDFIYALVIFVMVMPLTNTQPAMIELLRKLRLFNTHFSMWLTGASFRSMYFLIFYSFFKDLPNTYNEAAEIDGASQFSTMCRICIPLASKMISTVFLIQFVAAWNNYTTPNVYLPTKPTLAYAIFKLMNSTGSNTDINNTPRRIAALMSLAMPILILFVFLKNKLMGNISIGGIKE